MRREYIGLTPLRAFQAAGESRAPTTALVETAIREFRLELFHDSRATSDPVGCWSFRLFTRDPREIARFSAKSKKRSFGKTILTHDRYWTLTSRSGIYGLIFPSAALPKPLNFAVSSRQTLPLWINIANRLSLSLSCWSNCRRRLSAHSGRFATIVRFVKVARPAIMSFLLAKRRDSVKRGSKSLLRSACDEC